MIKRLENSADLDQTPQHAPSDQALHYLREEKKGVEVLRFKNKTGENNQIPLNIDKLPYLIYHNTIFY